MRAGDLLMLRHYVAPTRRPAENGIEEYFMLLSKNRALSIALSIAAGISASIQAQESLKYSVDVNVVNLLATVRDRNGHFVSNLTKDDFILEEEGRQQEIRYFSQQTDLPLKIGLLIDTSGSQQNLIADERSASYQFLDQVLRPDRDQAFVLQFATEAELLQDLTNSRSSLQKALKSLASSPAPRRSANSSGNSSLPDTAFPQNWPGRMPGGSRGSGGSQSMPGTQRRQAGAGTVLYDAVFLASDEILRNQEGRKAIILISDGVDNGSKVSEKEATDTAHRADTLIYCIRYYDSSIYSGPLGIGSLEVGSRGKRTLDMISQETGGHMFEVTKKLTLQGIYDKIQEELRNQYSIGYTQSNNNDKAFRHIKLRAKDKKLEVMTRTGYYPKS
jgi:VWFA-related protein